MHSIKFTPMKPCIPVIPAIIPVIPAIMTAPRVKRAIQVMPYIVIPSHAIHCASGNGHGLKSSGIGLAIFLTDLEPAIFCNIISQIK